MESEITEATYFTKRHADAAILLVLGYSISGYFRLRLSPTSER